MTATVPKDQARTPKLRIRDLSGHRDLLADLAEWAHEIRTRAWEGTRPWPTSSP
jgi:hypothetical protein